MRRCLFLIVPLLAVTASALGTFWLVTSRGIRLPAPIPSVAAAINSPSLLSGSASCSAAGCHGNVTSSNASHGIWGNECRVWLERDPHSQAYLVLLDESARHMVAHLGIGEPHRAKECLVCHAPGVAPSTDLAGLVLPEAIGCETCHGSATKWLTLHREPSWQKMTAAEKAALGMINTKDLLVRAELCAGCHVGAAGRDVNHDLIAAGHPRLNFEFTSYLAMLPRHWDEQAKDPVHPTYDPAFEARAWAVGQAVSAGAALELLAGRAAKGNSWPEFAELECAGCHHDLQFPSWRQTEVDSRESKPPLKLGSPRWGQWYFAMPCLLDDAESALPPFNSAPIDGITHTMSGYELAAPDLLGQIKQQQRALDQWAEVLNKANFDIDALSRFLSDTADREEQLAITNWDSGVQLYLALVALYQAKLDGQQAQGQALSPAEQQEIVKFEAMLNGLRHYHDFHPREYRDNLRGLRSQLTEEPPPTP